MPDPNPQAPSPNPQAIQLIVFDVDGVLTDGAITYDAMGVETKSFNVRDGLAMAKLARLGELRVGVLTSRSSGVVERRMHELGVTMMVQGSKHKGADIERMARHAHVPLEAVAYMGDDLVDLPALLKAGYPIAPADAVAEVRDRAAYVTPSAGGRGAARDAIEHLLKAQGKWDGVVAKYLD